MKKILRLSIFVVILAVFAMGTTFAFAQGAKTILNLAQSGKTAEEALAALTVSKRSDLRGNGTQDDTSTQSSDLSSSSSSDDEIEITGMVESITSDAIVVSGNVIAITSETEFEDEIAVGDMVEVEAISTADGTLTADEIELFEEDDFDDDSDGEDSDEDDFDDDSDEEDSDDDDSDDDEHEDEDSDDDDDEDEGDDD